ncbi:MAG: hypothetical protein AB7I04_12940 [Pseudomonadales bacterium]
MRIASTVAIFVLLITGQPVAADTPVASTLADILLTMQHFPSDAQKATLEDIAANEQVEKDLRIIAGAIGNIQHRVPDEERASLQAIVDDPSASEAAKSLASAALGFNHQLSADGRAALTALGG